MTEPNPEAGATPDGAAAPERDKPADFIREIIREHERNGRFGGRVHTRFPPEPNGYLHIGHTKSILLNHGLAQEFAGKFNLRYDDTNPTTEDVEYVEAIEDDLRWLGATWDGKFFASDYFEQLYGFAVKLIEKGNAYVCDLSPEEMSRMRGSLTEPGRNSPWRDRPVAENLDLFRRMRAGEFADGTRTLRAKLDMASPNLNLRDPALYRIRKAHHHRTGDAWCIYPMYDWAHGFCDSIEGITHSICTLEFENHRPLYDWFLDQLGVYHPQQIEFARLKLSHTVLSKRKLIRLVDGGHVAGWDDPRMATIAGIRRRGYTPTAIRAFCEKIGVARFNSTIEFQVLEGCLREELNAVAPRRLAVLRPLKVIVENWPADRVDEVELPNNPEDESAGTRKVPFSRELWIERDDFMEEPPKGFFRLAPGKEVRLRGAYFVTCTAFKIDFGSGEISEITVQYDPKSRGGQAPDGRKVKGTIHWVSASHAVDAEVRLYEHLFTTENPNDVPDGEDFTSNLNPKSLETLRGCKLEPSLRDAAPGSRFQFERLGYFFVDPVDAKAGKLAFNRTVTLRDSWAKEQKKSGPA